MDSQALEQQQDALLEQMQQMRTMYRGTLSEQHYLERRGRKDGEGATGPYYVWQGSVNGRHFSRRVHGARARQIQQGIEARHRFEHLCLRYIELGEARGELAVRETELSDALKKTPKSPSRRTRK